jgi:hypothetical protein
MYTENPHSFIVILHICLCMVHRRRCHLYSFSGNFIVLSPWSIYPIRIQCALSVVNNVPETLPPPLIFAYVKQTGKLHWAMPTLHNQSVLFQTLNLHKQIRSWDSSVTAGICTVSGTRCRKQGFFLLTARWDSMGDSPGLLCHDNGSSNPDVPTVQLTIQV